jgi:hypothetical protein
MLSFLNMFKKRISFSDGSFIEWCDKETLKYCEGARSCLVWVDFFDSSFLSGERLVHSESIKKWNIKNTKEDVPISIAEKKEILEKVILSSKKYISSLW